MDQYGLTRQEDHIITEQKAEVVKRLDEMRADNWRALEDMDAAELDALEAEIDGAAVVLDWGHPHNEARKRGYQAIRAERQKREVKRLEAERVQRSRSHNIHLAAQNIRTATQALEDAWAIPYEQVEYEPLPYIDVVAVSDDELEQARVKCLSIVQPFPIAAGEDALAIRVIKTDAARGIAKELDIQAQADNDRRIEAAKLLEDINAERDRREADRAKQPETLADRIARLEEIICDR